jgi:hypothetical protein
MGTGDPIPHPRNPHRHRANLGYLLALGQKTVPDKRRQTFLCLLVGMDRSSVGSRRNAGARPEGWAKIPMDQAAS